MSSESMHRKIAERECSKHSVCHLINYGHELLILLRVTTQTWRQSYRTEHICLSQLPLLFSGDIYLLYYNKRPPLLRKVYKEVAT